MDLPPTTKNIRLQCHRTVKVTSFIMKFISGNAFALTTLIIACLSAILLEGILAILLLIITLLIVGILSYFNHAYKYWENEGAPYIPPSFPYGNSEYLINRTATFGMETSKYYEEIKKMGEKFAGIYIVTRPVMVLSDPEYIKDILSTDFQYFVDRGFYYNEVDDPTSAHLFAVNQDKWRNLRAKLTPTFTSGKMKMMFKTVLDVSDALINTIGQSASMKKDVDIREVLECFTTDVIGSCAFGIDCCSLDFKAQGEFRQMGKKIFKIKNVLHLFRLILIVNFPKLARKLGTRLTRDDVVEFFSTAVKKNMKYREENNYSRPDFFQLLMDLKKSTKDTESPFTTEDMIAQVFLFFLAGFETSASVINFTLYELCRNERLQDKLREEINEVLAKHEGKVTYDSISEMKYLSQVIDETLRMYPPALALTRNCVNDYKLRDTDITLQKGIPVVIPVLALHRDPDLYPDPLIYNPERFNVQNSNDRHPFSYLPFGAGPRNCIGARFGLMQTKIGLVRILKNFRLRISSNTKMPLHLDPKIILIRSIETLYLKAESI